jgi:hypothetical protein
MQNANFYKFSSFQAKSYSLNVCMSIFRRYDNFEIQVLDSLILHLAKNHYSKDKVVICKRITKSFKKETSF